jgi:hypothetical protein
VNWSNIQKTGSDLIGRIILGRGIAVLEKPKKEAGRSM